MTQVRKSTASVNTLFFAFYLTKLFDFLCEYDKKYLTLCSETFDVVPFFGPPCKLVVSVTLRKRKKKENKNAKA